MAYRVKYTVLRPFLWLGRTLSIDDEFCDPDITQHQLDNLAMSGRLSVERTSIYQRGPGTKAEATTAA